MALVSIQPLSSCVEGVLSICYPKRSIQHWEMFHKYMKIKDIISYTFGGRKKERDGKNVKDL